MPEKYTIRVQGHLEERLQSLFPGLRITRCQNGETELFGTLPDQAALHGVLERIRDLNLGLVSVIRQPAEPGINNNHK
ncbi:MAG: hypothetical protein AAGU05_00205 [Anaerolineaceae bacterium]